MTEKERINLVADRLHPLHFVILQACRHILHSCKHTCCMAPSQAMHRATAVYSLAVYSSASVSGPVGPACKPPHKPHKAKSAILIGANYIRAFMSNDALA